MSEQSYAQRMADAWRKCQEFNAANPVGRPVVYKPAGDKAIETTTRSEAWALNSAETVVLVVGKTGGVALDNLVLV